MFIRSLLIVSLGLLPLAALSACGESSTKGDPSGIEEASEVTSGEVADSDLLIDQKNLKFVPGQLRAAVGDTIYFRNSEAAVHTVTINGVNVTGDMTRNTIMAWKPSRPGTYQLTCDYHPQMRATITVE